MEYIPIKEVHMKNLYNAIINLLPSTTLKEKIIETNFNISDMDLVYIVDHYTELISDKINLLNRLNKTSINENAKVRINRILEDIAEAKLLINDESIISSFDYDMCREFIWEDADTEIIDGVAISLICKEYKPNWPIFLNKFDLIKVKPYYDKDNYHYAMINNFQEEFKGPTATVFLFEDVNDSDLYAKEEYNGELYYVIPYNFAHDHIPFECIEKVELNDAPENIKSLYLKIMEALDDRANISKYFYSEEIRNRLADHKFSDVEKASIIDSAIYPFDDKIKDFYELMDNTVNYTLYKQLKSYVNELKELIPNLSKHEEDEFYELMDYFKDKYYYKNFDEAYQKGLELPGSENIYFQISKKKFNEWIRPIIYCFNHNGKLVWTNEDVSLDCKDEELFYDTYIKLPNIFADDGFRVAKRYLPVPDFESDFVILCDDQTERYNFQNELINKGLPLDISDSGPYIYIISTDGEVWEEPWGVFVNMYFVPENEMTLSMFQDIEFLKRGIK